MAELAAPKPLPPINLTPQEIEEAEALIAKGELPRDAIDRWYDDVEKNVFGHDHKRDRKGNPIEQGIGSAGHQTRNSIEAYKKYGKDEPDFQANLVRMEKELVEANARRKAEADRNTPRRRRSA